MYLRKIALKDWKAYIDATFEFPCPEEHRNVVLIGARNGYGKTSLFEAVVLGLFGRDGLPLIARAPFGSSADDRLQFSYNSFLAESLYRNALAENRRSASVTLEFETELGEPLALRRIWHFSPDGKHKPGDEELRIYEGNDGRPIGPPTGEDEVDWRRSYVARNLLPHTLAAFFLFDGEQVQVLAERDMSVQVRTGIEGLLGIQVLRELVLDLHKYADNRRYTAGGKITSKTIAKIRDDLLVFEHDHDIASEEFDQVSGEWERLTNRRNSITRELTSIGAGATDTTVKDRYEELNSVKRALEDLRTQRDRIVASDISLALTGRTLRTAALERLKQEAVREEWQTGRRQGEAGLERFLSSLAAALDDIEPKLLEDQRKSVIGIVQTKWEELWHPAPEGCAPDYRHSYARAAERERICQHLNAVDRLSVSGIRGMLNEQRRLSNQRQQLENEIASLEGLSPQIEQKATELKELNDKIDKLAVDRGRLQRELEAIASQLNAKRQELARNVQSFDQAAPRLRLADRADRVANVLQAIIKDAVPHEIETVAQAMTTAFKAMSHKNIVEHVEIAEDCTVRLLSAEGFNVRELAASAGENQIFAQALISAIARVSQRNFPIVVDTPLGRLDDAHRAGVLQHFTERIGQVILLSTDTEVVGRYLDVVKPRLSATYHIDHEHQGQVGRSRVVRGYFPGTGV